MKKWVKNNLWIFGIIIVISAIIFFCGNKRSLDTEFNNGSKIKIENLSKNQIENLSKLCKVWGFAKYYDQEVVSGNINWDYELFRVMPDILNEKNPDKVNKILYDWIKKQGNIKENPIEKSENEEVALKRNIDWINDKNYLGKDLSDLLIKMSSTNILDRKNAYVSFDDESIYSNFENEKPYISMKFDDSGYKLLSLFRYWNIIEYYYPYRDIIGENWDEVLKEFIPKFIKGNDKLDYELKISELTSKIHDAHAWVLDEDKTLDKYWGNKYAPIEFTLVDDKIVISKILPKYAKDCQLKRGDIVLKLNGEDINKIIKDKSKYISLTRKEAIVNCLQKYLFRASDDSVKFTIERDGKELTKNVKYYSDQSMFDTKEPSHKILDKDIVYINPGQLAEGEIDKIMKKSMDKKGIIVDLRYYPSYPIMDSLSNYLYEKPVDFVKISFADRQIPGEFITFENFKMGIENKNYYKGKVVILIDERSQSQSEYTTMALRKSPNATVVGSDSIGSDGDVAFIPLPGMVKTTISGLGIYNIDGSQTQRVGIKPNIYVKPTIQSIKEGKDEILQKAIDVINN